MPRNTREWALRKIESASNTLDWTGKHLAEVAAVYETLHPEISGPIDQILALIVELQNAILKVRGLF